MSGAPFWLRPLGPWLDRTLAGLAGIGDGQDDTLAVPAGEAALFDPDSVSWQVFRNPASLLIGGVAAVVLELAEPRVRSGVLDHSGFRRDPQARLRRTGRAAMLAVYGPSRRAEASIARIRALHGTVAGRTPTGVPYRADDPALLSWVHATASYGFLAARHCYVEPVSIADQDRYYREGQASARLYGATGVPESAAEMTHLLDQYRPRLEASPLIHEFLRTMQRLPLVPRPLAPLQRLLVAAGVALLPPWVHERLGLGDEWAVTGTRAAVLRGLLRQLDRLPLPSSAPAQACRRLGLPDDHLRGARWLGSADDRSP